MDFTKVHMLSRERCFEAAGVSWVRAWDAAGVVQSFTALKFEKAVRLCCEIVWPKRSNLMMNPIPSTQPTGNANHLCDLEPSQCAFCLRVMQNGTTEHHLIPKTCHKNKWFKKQFSREQMRETVPACRACHSAIHDLVPREKELGRHFFTVPLLLAHPEFARFVDWVSRQK